MNTRKVDESGFAGMGAVDPNAEREHRKNVEDWEAFRRLTKLKIGDRAQVGAHTITLSRLTPIGSGLVRVQGTYPGGCVDQRVRPSEISQA